MYKTDARAKGVIQTLARDMTRGGFSVSIPEDRSAEEIATGLAKRLKLSTRLDDWVRLALRDGDTFLEIGVAATRWQQVRDWRRIAEAHAGDAPQLQSL